MAATRGHHPTRKLPLVAPLVFYTLAFRTLVFRPAAHNAAVGGYSLERRRYVGQFAC
ncbi:hypothetical protein ACW0JT_08165 [Arthrobacter sp. SA17]